jgi:hypothetical protein
MVPAALPSPAVARLAVTRTAMPHATAVLPHRASFGAAAGRADPLGRIALLASAAVQTHRTVREAAAGIRARIAFASSTALVMHRPAIVPAVHLFAMHPGAMMGPAGRGQQRKRGYQHPYTRNVHDSSSSEI